MCYIVPPAAQRVFAARADDFWICSTVSAVDVRIVDRR
jgi:hypothetical protein